MSFHRVLLIAFAPFFIGAMASPGFAGCGGCGWGFAAPGVYESPAPAPTYAPAGCGSCGAPIAPAFAPAVAYAPPPAPLVAPLPVAPAPIAVDHWDTGGFGNCGGFTGCGALSGCNCGGAVAYAPPVEPAPAPLYIVNQGPEYSGPGFMVPFRAYSPGLGLANPAEYPYIRGPRYSFGGYSGRYVLPYGGARYVYHRRYGHPYPYRPLGPRG